MNSSRLQRFFEQRRARGEPLVMVAVTATDGSTYSKAGDLMLIDQHGVACGMLSGGCLESDLAARAQVVLESGQPQSVTYELASGDEDVWGLGIGCDGSMTIGLQMLTAKDDYAPLQIPTPTQLLVLGAGLDAVPLARLANEMGWQCTVVDHRPAYIERGDFPEECAKHCIAATALNDTVVVDDFDAVVVMSHHLESDREYLRQIAGRDVGYAGLLGPAGRRDRLVSEIGDAAEALRDTLQGPAGLSLGGRGPEVVALSIVAQIQETLAAS